MREAKSWVEVVEDMCLWLDAFLLQAFPFEGYLPVAWWRNFLEAAKLWPIGLEVREETKKGYLPYKVVTFLKEAIMKGDIKKGEGASMVLLGHRLGGGIATFIGAELEGFYPSLLAVSLRGPGSSLSGSII